MKQKPSFLGISGLLLAAIGCWAAVWVVPEVREFLGLDKETREETRSVPAPEGREVRKSLGLDKEQQSVPAPEGKEAMPPGLEPSPSPGEPEAARRQATASSEFPVQARLQEGEQRVMLGGDLGVSVVFSEVASTPIATLRINHEGTEEMKALPMAGDAFTVIVRGVGYRVSVLRLSFDAGEIDVQIDKVD